ncbi:MAG TPA: PAS domain-containing protein, partial [Gammaproteobacteria bacterium]|nr:PAS domain-containing protein [Gammaproteobacteria bacterium]
MKQPEIPVSENERLEALYRYNILDTPAEKYFDQLTELAAFVCNTPVATITFIDENREWYKSRIGISDSEASRDISFCAHTILNNDLFIIPDTYKDKIFADNPFVLQDPPLRFYAGAPLITTDGYALGTVCVIDHIPRELTSDQKNALKKIAKQIMLQLEVHEKKHLLDSKIRSKGKIIKKELREIKKTYEQISRELNLRIASEIESKIAQNRLAQALESAQTGIWEWDLQTGKIVWNTMHEHIFGYQPGTFNGSYKEFEKRVHPDDQVKLKNALDSAIKTKQPYLYEFRIIWPDKSIHWVRGKGEFVYDKHGKPVRLYGVVNDITTEKDAQIKLDRSIRALRVLSLCNAAITDAHDELKLLERVCRLMIEDGGYRFAWIGYPQDDKQKTVKPMAHAGYEAGYLGNLITWNNNDTRGRGPTGRAIRSGKNIIARKIAEDPRFRPWRKPALERGYASSVALILRANKEKPLGTLMVYSSEVDAFDKDEVRLLTELANNLARCIHSLRLQESLDSTRKVATQQLRELEILYETAPIGYALMDKSCRYLKVNKTLAEMNGLPAEEHIGKSINEIIPETAPVIRPIIKQVLKTGKPVLGMEIQEWSPVYQKKMYWLTHFYPLGLPDGKKHAVNIIIQNITDLKNLEKSHVVRAKQA